MKKKDRKPNRYILNVNKGLKPNGSIFNVNNGLKWSQNGLIFNVYHTYERCLNFNFTVRFPLGPPLYTRPGVLVISANYWTESLSVKTVPNSTATFQRTKNEDKNERYCVSTCFGLGGGRAPPKPHTAYFPRVSRRTSPSWFQLHFQQKVIVISDV